MSHCLKTKRKALKTEIIYNFIVFILKIEIVNQLYARKIRFHSNHYDAIVFVFSELEKI